MIVSRSWRQKPKNSKYVKMPCNSPVRTGQRDLTNEVTRALDDIHLRVIEEGWFQRATHYQLNNDPAFHVDPDQAAEIETEAEPLNVAAEVRTTLDEATHEQVYGVDMEANRDVEPTEERQMDDVVER